MLSGKDNYSIQQPVWLDWGFRLLIAIEIKVGLVFGNFVLNRNINLNLVPNLAKWRDVMSDLQKTYYRI